MNDFNNVLDIVLEHEGYYSNDKDDTGLETYRGISRRYHPTWEGWSIIDSMKKNKKFPQCIKANDSVDALVSKFYKENFWNILLCDNISRIDKKIAVEVFDTSVNMGTHRAVLFLQQGLNLLNSNTRLWDDIVDDGIIGNKTLQALNLCKSHNRIPTLLKILNVFQANHYIEYMKKSPVQEKYAVGWFKRVDIGRIA